MEQVYELANNGADIVLVDNDPDTYMIKIDEIEKKITTKTKAIIVVHLYGSMPDMDAICNIAKKNNLLLIEDNSQAPLAIEKNKYCGTIGHIGIFSLNRHKHIQSGEGGICVTDDSSLAEKLQLIRNHPLT